MDRRDAPHSFIYPCNAGYPITPFGGGGGGGDGGQEGGGQWGGVDFTDGYDGMPGWT